LVLQSDVLLSYALSIWRSNCIHTELHKVILTKVEVARITLCSILCREGPNLLRSNTIAKLKTWRLWATRVSSTHWMLILVVWDIKWLNTSLMLGLYLLKASLSLMTCRWQLWSRNAAWVHKIVSRRNISVIAHKLIFRRANRVHQTKVVIYWQIILEHRPSIWFL